MFSINQHAIHFHHRMCFSPMSFEPSSDWWILAELQEIALKHTNTAKTFAV